MGNGLSLLVLVERVRVNCGQKNTVLSLRDSFVEVIIGMEQYRTWLIQSFHSQRDGEERVQSES